MKIKWRKFKAGGMAMQRPWGRNIFSVYSKNSRWFGRSRILVLLDQLLPQRGEGIQVGDAVTLPQSLPSCPSESGAHLVISASAVPPRNPDGQS